MQIWTSIIQQTLHYARVCCADALWHHSSAITNQSLETRGKQTNIFGHQLLSNLMSSHDKTQPCSQFRDVLTIDFFFFFFFKFIPISLLAYVLCINKGLKFLCLHSVLSIYHFINSFSKSLIVNWIKKKWFSKQPANSNSLRAMWTTLTKWWKPSVSFVSHFHSDRLNSFLLL